MGTPKLWNKSNHTSFVVIRKKWMYLPLCYQGCYIEPKKQWLIVMKYNSECIKTVEWFKSYINCIGLKQTSALNLILLTMFYLIDETMNDSDEVWKWVNQNYGICLVVRKFYWVERKKHTHLTVPGDVRLNWQNNE